MWLRRRGFESSHPDRDMICERCLLEAAARKPAQWNTVGPVYRQVFTENHELGRGHRLTHLPVSPGEDSVSSLEDR